MIELTAIVVEDQPAIWDYARLCLQDSCKILEFCSTSAEAERAFFRYKPDLVWLDCYLGELADTGLQNSGLLLAAWIKKHKPQTKIFLFTAAHDPTILKAARDIGVEGIALGAKFIKDKQIIIQGLKSVLEGRFWLSPCLVENFELDEFSKITVFEIAVLCSSILGKSTGQIAEELDTTRKQINNAIYRVRQKLNIEEGLSRASLLALIKDRLVERFNFNDQYAISDIVAVNTAIQEFLGPLLLELKSGALHRVSLSST